MNKKKRLKAAADLFGCHPSEFMSYRLLDDGGINVIGPEGKKYKFSAETIAREAKFKEQLDEITEAVHAKYERDESEQFSMSNLKDELIAACEARDLPTSGTKAELLERLNE